MKKNGAGNYFRAAGRQVQHYLARKKLTEEDVHDLRVAARRIKTLAADFAELFPAKCWKVERQAGRIIRQYASVREQQLFERFVAQLGLGDREQPVVDLVSAVTDTGTRRKFGKRFRKCCNLLQKSRKLTGMDGLINQWRTSFVQLADALSPACTEQELHKIRIAAKKMRYRLECFAPDADEQISYFTVLQGELGEFNALSVFRRQLRDVDLTVEQRETAYHFIEQKAACHRARVLNLLKTIKAE